MGPPANILKSPPPLAAPVPWRLPAEWEPQETVLFVWPRDPLTWPDRLDRARRAYAEAVRAVAEHQRVDLLARADLQRDARATTAGSGVRLWPVEHQDSWVRDYGPLTLVDDGGGRRFLKFDFDAWGGKYESLLADDAVVGRLTDAGLLPPTQRVPFVLEGGAVETDGQGTFLATESVCAGRGQSVAEHEAALREHLGARHVVWLGEGIEGDDTDGHVDTITRFVRPGTVVTTVAPEGHPDHAALAENRARLADAVDARGRSIEVVELPAAPRQETPDGAVLPAGHANFLITNGCVVVPGFGGPSDREAAALLEELVGRPAVLVDHRELIWGFGGIHCLSMQVPAGRSRLPEPDA